MAKSLRVNVAIATFALVLFGLVGMSSGRLDVHGGLGWDGEMYARMVTGRLSDGTANTAVRPLVILAVRIPYRLGVDVLRSFAMVNTIAAFVVYLIAALVLERSGLDVMSRAVVVANLALTISVSKMFGFYPALIDLGALAILMVAFYLAATDRLRLAAAACVLATASREFGVAAALFGAHRAIRTGRTRDAWLFLPSLAVSFLIRLPVFGILPNGATPLGLGTAARQLRMWAHPSFVVAFAYFSITLLGGITALLLLRAPSVALRLRKEPELATFAATVVLLTVVAGYDHSRYLVFALPVALVSVAAVLRDAGVNGRRRILTVMTLITVWTQRPFEAMTADSYFLHWFPLYRIPGLTPVPPDVLAVWMPRLVTLVLLLIASFFAIRQATRPSVART